MSSFNSSIYKSRSATLSSGRTANDATGGVIGANGGVIGMRVGSRYNSAKGIGEALLLESGGGVDPRSSCAFGTGEDGEGAS